MAHVPISCCRPQNVLRYAEMVDKFEVEYIAGGATQNSIRVAQWMLEDEKCTTSVGCVGNDACVCACVCVCVCV